MVHLGIHLSEICTKQIQQFQCWQTADMYPSQSAIRDWLASGWRLTGAPIKQEVITKIAVDTAHSMAVNDSDCSTTEDSAAGSLFLNRFA